MVERDRTPLRGPPNESLQVLFKKKTTYGRHKNAIALHAEKKGHRAVDLWTKCRTGNVPSPICFSGGFLQPHHAAVSAATRSLSLSPHFFFLPLSVSQERRRKKKSAIDPVGPTTSDAKNSSDYTRRLSNSVVCMHIVLTVGRRKKGQNLRNRVVDSNRVLLPLKQERKLQGQTEASMKKVAAL